MRASQNTIRAAQLSAEASDDARAAGSNRADTINDSRRKAEGWAREPRAPGSDGCPAAADPRIVRESKEAAGRIAAEDVQTLCRNVLPDGLTCRDEADMLIALDRVATSDAAFGDYLVASVLDFAVWGERPTGYIDAEIARGYQLADAIERIAFANR